jgi:hypothetical protein
MTRYLPGDLATGAERAACHNAIQTAFGRGSRCITPALLACANRYILTGKGNARSRTDGFNSFNIHFDLIVAAITVADRVWLDGWELQRGCWYRTELRLYDQLAISHYWPSVLSSHPERETILAMLASPAAASAYFALAGGDQ